MAEDARETLTKDELKDKVRAIILSQGNHFIKELLREHSIKIGCTKKEFAKNITGAIEDGTLTREKIEAWLEEIEGWGNQHLYLFKAPTVATEGIDGLLADSDHKNLVGRGQSFDFPEELTLSSVTRDADSLSLIWHLGKEGWDRAKFKDYVKKIGLDRYRFDAYRQRMDRSVVRFEWRFADKHCAIFIHRSKDIDHDQVIAIVWEVVQGLGICEKPCDHLSLSQAVKWASKQKGTKQTRLEADGGFIELVSTLKDGGIDEVEAVRRVRNAVDDSEFSRAQGMFSVRYDDEDDEPMSVQVFGSQGRLRLWAQCKRDVVYSVIGYFIVHNEAESDG
jgi:hypothetical protein